MANLSDQIATARASGYSDDQIAAFLSKDAGLAPKIQQARGSGYSATEVVDYLRGSVADKAIGRKPTIADMRSLTDPGYAKARERQKLGAQIDKEAKTKYAGGKVMGALGEWNDQLGRNLGVRDDISGGVSYGAQVAENAVRRLLGKPVEISPGAAGQAARDFERERQSEYAKEHPVGNALATLGGIAVGGAPARGFQATMTPLRAGATVAATNAPFAVARQDGTLKERAPGAALETAVTFGMGSALQAGSNALGNRAAAARARAPTDARVLSDEGVDLTPGQMLGGMGKRIEDASTSIPGVGDAIRGRQTDSLRSFNRAVVNRALDPIGEQLAPGVTGREAIAAAQDAISGAYNRALDPVSIAPDNVFGGDVAAIVGALPQRAQQEVSDVVDDIVTRQFRGTISGRQWKVIDEELGEAIRSAERAAASGQPGAAAQRPVARALTQVQQAYRRTLERAAPEAAAEVARANEAFANMVRINGAAQSTATAKTDGLFTPTQLNLSVARKGSGRAYARGEALMQDISDPAARVLPSSVPDSGTPLRSWLGMIGAAGGGVAGAGVAGAGATAAPVAGGILGANALASAVYSRPVIRLLNVIYRASTPGQKREALSKLAALAARDPALAPLYRQAAEQLGVRLPSSERRQNALQGQPQPTSP